MLDTTFAFLPNTVTSIFERNYYRARLKVFSEMIEQGVK